MYFSLVITVWASPVYGVLDFVGLLLLQLLKAWYIWKMRVIKPNSSDNHRIPSLLQYHAAFVPIFHADRPPTVLHLFYSSDLKAQPYMPILDERERKFLEVGVCLC
jgi:hypothetical protein